VRPIKITDECLIYNDMPRGWVAGKGQPKWHLSLYTRWKDMWKRCYNSEHPEYSNYKDCPIDDRYHLLSNYVHDIELLEGFDLLKENPSQWEIDKDKIDPNNRKYYFEHLSVVSKYDNRKERLDRCGVPMKDPQIAKKRYRAIKGVSLEDNSIITFNSISEATRAGFNLGHIIECCSGKRKSHKGYKWEYL